MKKDNINHPKHYTSSKSKCECGKTIECNVIKRRMSANLGDAYKYLHRAGLKDDIIQDLRKAIWYINDEIEMISEDRED